MASRPGLATLPAVQETLLKRTVEPHVASFDFFLQEGLKRCIANLDPVQIDLPDGKGVSRTSYFISNRLHFLLTRYKHSFKSSSTLKALRLKPPHRREGSTNSG